MFVLDSDKSARAQLTALMSELQKEVTEKKAKRDQYGPRTDAFKGYSSEVSALNSTIALIMSIDVMRDGYQDNSTNTKNQHVPTYSYDAITRRELVVCMCGWSQQSTSLMVIDHAYGKHVRKALTLNETQANQTGSQPA